jgi:hypothetical protein
MAPDPTKAYRGIRIRGVKKAQLGLSSFGNFAIFAAIRRASAGCFSTLCPNCSECPEVEITDQGVTIGEYGNTLSLSHVLNGMIVRLIKDGKLHEVWKLKTSATST